MLLFDYENIWGQKRQLRFSTLFGNDCSTQIVQHSAETSFVHDKAIYSNIWAVSQSVNVPNSIFLLL